MNRTFERYLVGFSVSVCFQAMIMDYLGKDKYLDLTSKTWVEHSPWFWFAAMLVIIALELGREIIADRERALHRRRAIMEARKADGQEGVE